MSGASDDGFLDDLDLSPEERYTAAPTWMLAVAAILGVAAIGCAFVAGTTPRVAGLVLGVLAVIVATVFKAQERQAADGLNYVAASWLPKAVLVTMLLAIGGIAANVWPVAKSINDRVGTCACSEQPASTEPGRVGGPHVS